MAKRFTVEMIMNLAKAIGANPNKFMGTKTNINFLGKGPTKNPLFQEPLAGIETATEAQLGKRESIIEAVEDAMGYFSSGKLNSIQTEILGHNLSGIKNIYNPPVLPMASVTDIAPGIAGLKKFPRESHQFFGRPLKSKDFSEIDRMVMEGKIPDARGRTWNFKTPGTIKDFSKASNERFRNQLADDLGSRLPEPGPGDLAAFTGALDQKTGMSRAIARNLLLKDTRLKLSSDDLFMLKEGKGEPLDLMQKYYGRSMSAYDDFLNQVNLEAARPDEFAAMILKNVKLIPQFAEGGLADVLQVRSGYSKGRMVKGALAILNRNKKNADYMFKASDNVSPGYAAGDLKYNAELLADQLADDAGVVFADLDSISQTKFYGTAYDYLAKEMGQYRQMTKMLKDVEQKMQLSDFNIKGRKPSASGGLAGILEV